MSAAAKAGESSHPWMQTRSLHLPASGPSAHTLPCHAVPARPAPMIHPLLAGICTHIHASMARDYVCEDSGARRGALPCSSVTKMSCLTPANKHLGLQAIWIGRIHKC